MDYFSGVTEAIKKASVAFTEALSTVSSVLLNIAGQAPAGADRDRIVENWLRIARMSQDGVVSAIEHGFELWESECRRMMGASKSVSAAQGAANPMETWAENWKKATETFTGGAGWSDQAREQAELAQKTLDEGLKAWRRLWTPEKEP
jgi:hypothetical protein